VLRDMRFLLPDDLADLAEAFTQVLLSLATEARNRVDVTARPVHDPPGSPAQRVAVDRLLSPGPTGTRGIYRTQSWSMRVP
jgi:hypothetical protein